MENKYQQLKREKEHSELFFNQVKELTLKSGYTYEDVIREIGIEKVS